MNLQYLMLSSSSVVQSFVFQSCTKIRKGRTFGRLHSSNKEDPPVPRVPSNFDPTAFDIFDDGGTWSNNINNPLVAAQFVNSLDDGVDDGVDIEKDNDFMNMKKKQK